MPEQLYSGDWISFVRQGGIPVTVVRYGGTYVRVTRFGGKEVTFVRNGGTLITVEDEALLPEDVKEQIGS